jgi:membrane associated rhomboid family serine protease
MFLPIGDTPNPRDYTPWMNWLIIALNIAVYILITLPLSRQGVSPDDPMLGEYLRAIATQLPPGVTIEQVLSSVSAYDLYTFVHGYKPGAPGIADLFYSLFLHGGFLHLAGNMLFLWIYGDNVEHRLGRIGYLLTYLSTGAMATLFFSLLAHGSMTPLVGASGAISGVLGVYFLIFPRNKIKVFIALIPFYIDVLLMPSRLVLGIFLVIDNLLPLLLSSHSPVAYGAHIGGFFGGLGIAYAGEKLSWNWPWSDTMWRMGKTHPGADEPGPGGEASNLSRVRAAMTGNSPDKAVDILTRMHSSEIADLTPHECVLLSEWLDDAGHPIAASNLLRRCVVHHKGSESLADVYLTLGLMRLKQEQPTAAYQYLLASLENRPSPETEKRARDALGRIDMYRSAR